MTALVKKYRLLSIPAIIGYGGLLTMLTVVCYALMYGDFFKEGAVLVDMAWGMVTLVDLYLGLLLFSVWVIWREKNKKTGLLWSVLVLLLGNMFSCLYVLKALYQAEGNMHRFWLGEHSETQ